MAEPPRDQAAPGRPCAQLVRVWTSGEAMIIRQLLASYGIACQVVSPVSRTFSIDGLGAIRILVSEDRLDQARKLLAEHRRQGLRVIRGGKAAQAREGGAASGRSGA